MIGGEELCRIMATDIATSVQSASERSRRICEAVLYGNDSIDEAARRFGTTPANIVRNIRSVLRPVAKEYGILRPVDGRGGRR